MFAIITGNECVSHPYIIQRKTPLIKRISIVEETSPADFSLQVFINCGKNAKVVKPAAINPKVSGWLRFSIENN